MKKYVIRNKETEYEMSQFSTFERAKEELEDYGKQADFYEIVEVEKELTEIQRIAKKLREDGINGALISAMSDEELLKADKYEDYDDYNDFMSYMARKYHI